MGTAGHFHGFLYNRTSWIDLDPGLPDLAPTLLYGISGNYAVGLGTDPLNKNHGLLYNITTQHTGPVYAVESDAKEAARIARIAYMESVGKEHDMVVLTREVVV